jgi:hypothetical protein
MSGVRRLESDGEENEKKKDHRRSAAARGLRSTVYSPRPSVTGDRRPKTGDVRS